MLYHSIFSEQNLRKVVPCIYKRCIIPPQLSFYISLHYENPSKLFNFWDKLHKSIQTATAVAVLNSRITIEEIESSSQVETVQDRPQSPPKLRSHTPGSIPASEHKKSLLSRFRATDKDKAKSFWDMSSKKSEKVVSVQEELKPKKKKKLLAW